MGLLAGWTDWLSNTAAVAAFSVACANFLGVTFPAIVLYSAPVAAAFALTIIALNWSGVREGQIAQSQATFRVPWQYRSCSSPQSIWRSTSAC